MASIVAMRDALKTRLETISGLRVRDHTSGAINPPFAVIIPGSPAVSFDKSMVRGSDTFNFLVFVAVSAAEDRVSHEALDAYLAGSGAKSIKAAIEGNGANLEGNADWVRVTEVRNYGPMEWANVQYLGAEFVIGAMATGT